MAKINDISVAKENSLPTTPNVSTTTIKAEVQLDKKKNSLFNLFVNFINSISVVFSKTNNYYVQNNYYRDTNQPDSENMNTQTSIEVDYTSEYDSTEFVLPEEAQPTVSDLSIKEKEKGIEDYRQAVEEAENKQFPESDTQGKDDIDLGSSDHKKNLQRLSEHREAIDMAEKKQNFDELIANANSRRERSIFEHSEKQNKDTQSKEDDREI